jgi:hypothetical protein
MSEEFDFNFLEERPLKKSEEFFNAKFGHEEISSALCKTIAKCPTPFTIGLFGRWGAGKSTIANSIREKLLPKKIAVVLFDVWKHEGDALRRTFLKEAVGQLKALGNDYFDTSFKIDERLEQSVSRSSESKFILNKGKIKQLLWACGIALLLIGVSWLLAFWLGFGNQYWNFIRTLIGPAIGITSGGALVIFLIKNAVHLFSAETVTYGVDKLQDPHEFETEFGRILGGLRNSRLLVIFDNLDRATHDKALEVLSTIKTFLEPKDIENQKKEVVFLVPCDARAIKSHVANVYKSVGVGAPFDPDEFLRKFFNSIIWIPDFILSELENFARTSLKKTKVKDLDDDRVAWIIIKAFRENPRQIIQFINILLANYLLVKEREGKGDFPKDFAKNNIAQLTKYLILSELFPDEMEVLRNSKVLDLRDVKKDELKTENKENFVKFLDETKQDIPIDNLRIFFTLRRSEQEKKFPGVESFASMLEDKKIDEAIQYFDKLGDFSNFQVRDDFSQVVKTELETKINPVSAVNLIGTLLTILDKKGINLSNTAYVEINNKLSGLCIKFLHSISPVVLNQQLLIPFSGYRLIIVKQWVEVIEDYSVGGKSVYQATEDFIHQALRVFADHPDYLDRDSLSKIKKFLSTNLATNIEIAEIFIEDVEKQKKYLTSEYIQTAFNGIPAGGDGENINKRLSILSRIDSEVMKSTEGNFIVTKLSEIQNAENKYTTPDRIPTKELIVKSMANFIDAQFKVFSTASESTGDLLVTSVITGIGAIGDQENKRIFIPILVRVNKIASNQKKQEIESQTKSFFSSANTAGIDYVIERVKEPEMLLEQNQYSALEKRSLDDQNFFDYFYKKLSKTKKEELINRLFDHDFDRAIQFAERENYKVPNPKSLCEKTLAKFDVAPSLSDKKRLLDAAIALRGANDVNVRDSIADKLQVLLTSTDNQFQDLGHTTLITAEKEKLISKPRKRQIAKGVFDWLKKPELPTKYQPSAIKSIYTFRDEFNDEEDKEFLQFIFEELIRKTNNTEHIDLGFSLLQGIAPKYEERKENFDDVKARIESEPEGALRQSLLKGLKSIRPEGTKKQNKAYWESVDLLS